MKKLITVPSNYKIVFEEFFGDKLIETKWLTRQSWGSLHFDDPHQYYEPNNVVVNDGLKLYQKHEPKIIHERGKEIMSTYSIGLISSKESWKYGWFEAEIKLPKGKGLWPAFWLSGVDSWPPEIDVVEGYTKKKNNYNKFLIFKRDLETNVHYGEQIKDSNNNVIKSHSHIGGKEVWMWKDPTNHYIKYSCHWTKDFIKIYYDGKLVREVTDKNILKYFKVPMRVILNTAVHDEYAPDWEQTSVMEVKSLRVYQKDISVDIYNKWSVIGLLEGLDNIEDKYTLSTQLEELAKREINNGILSMSTTLIFPTYVRLFKNLNTREKLLSMGIRKFSISFNKFVKSEVKRNRDLVNVDIEMLLVDLFAEEFKKL